MKLKQFRRLLVRRAILLGCLLLTPATIEVTAGPLVGWLVDTGLAHVLVAGAFVACLFLLNRITFDLYQEFQHRE